MSDCRLSTFEEIKNLVLSENSNKKILYWGDDKTVELEIKNDSSFEKSKPLKLFEISLENILLCISMLVFYKFIKFAIK